MNLFGFQSACVYNILNKMDDALSGGANEIILLIASTYIAYTHINIILLSKFIHYILLKLIFSFDIYLQKQKQNLNKKFMFFNILFI